jgi:urease gamma subunit
LKLNYPEAVALLTVHVFEEARAGGMVNDIMASGRTLLCREELMEGVPEMIENVQVEATFPDGTKLVSRMHPRSRRSIRERPNTTKAAIRCTGRGVSGRGGVRRAARGRAGRSRRGSGGPARRPYRPGRSVPSPGSACQGRPGRRRRSPW